jgi:hypothetical protein
MSIENEVRHAIERGRHIQARVRDITLAALARGELDGAAMRKVTREVLKLIEEAATVQGARAQDVMADAVAGVDQALAHAAQALKLSIDEAAGRAQQFSREDLAKARASLKDLEQLFLDTLRETARASRGAASTILNDLAKHAEASGTAVGRQLEQMSGLSGRMAEAGRAHFEAGVNAALTSGAMMARVASGVLAGIAESLEEKGKGRPR